jgi:hypothetical protein
MRACLRDSLLITALLLSGCAQKQQVLPPSPPPAPAHPWIEGNFKTVSSGDIRRGLDIVRKHMIEEYGSALPIYGVYVVDQNHMSIRYWAKGLQTWTYVERIKKKWQLSGDTAVELIITTGSNIPTG